MKVFIHRNKFVAISITGRKCELMCKHCGAKYLEGMVALDRNNAYRILEELYSLGVRGALISGGFTKDGRLPIDEFLDMLRIFRRRHEFVFNVHLGLERRDHVLQYVKEIADVIDFEFTVSSYIVNYIRNLSLSPKIYIEVLDKILDCGLVVVPHIYLWHPMKSLEELKLELDLLKDRDIDRVTLLVFIPQNHSYVPVNLVKEYLSFVRNRFEGEVYLGCMRPFSIKKEIDIYAVENSLIDRIANPHPAIYRLFPHLEVYDACCSIPRDKLLMFATFD